jgi:DNA polymerase-3 subunit epsilon
MARSLARLRARGEPLGLVELAGALVAARGPLGEPLARRILAAALGVEADSLPGRFEARELRPAEEAALAHVPLERASFAVVDLETTGLAPGSAAIIEIGAVRVSRLRCGAVFETLVRPPHALPRAIGRLTGIDDAMLAGAPPARCALRRFRAWLGRAPRAPFVAHQAAFDAGFVAAALRAQALPAHRVPVFCTRRLARRLLPRLGRYDLDHLCAHFGIRNAARHRALGDARATARAWVELLALARARRVRTLGELLDLQASPPPRTSARPSRRPRPRSAS